MGCQKTIANRILERGADYLLGLNTARRSWRCRSGHCFAHGATPVFDAFDDSRLVRRRVFVCPEA